MGGRFDEAADPVVRREKASECLVAADIDQDGWTDLLFCGGRDPQAGALTYRNVAGAFQDVTRETAYRTVPARAIELVDVNRDGKPDLLLVEPKRLTVWLNTSGGFPRIDFSYPLDEGHDIAVGDVNLDRVPDIYIVQGKNELFDDIMLLGTSTAVGYRAIPIPQAVEGEGDLATTFPDWDRSGRAAFLVTNGRWSLAGPVQLIAFSAATAPVQLGLPRDENDPAPPGWALDGFVAGLDDPAPGVFVQLSGIGHRLGFWPALERRSSELAPKVVARLSDPDTSVRAAALAALGALGAREQARRVADRLGDADASVRRAAGLALRALAGQPGEAAVLDRPGNPATLRRARIAVENQATGEQATTVAARLGDPDADVRRAAVAALMRLGASEQAPTLAGGLSDTDPVVRRAAIGALMHLGAREHAPAVVARLGDRDIDVARAAVVALRVFGAKEQVPAIAPDAGRPRSERARGLTQRSGDAWGERGRSSDRCTAERSRCRRPPSGDRPAAEVRCRGGGAGHRSAPG